MHLILIGMHLFYYTQLRKTKQPIFSTPVFPCFRTIVPLNDGIQNESYKNSNYVSL